jgi:hypothetical protein
MLRKVYIPKISIFKTFWRHLKPCHTMPKSNNDASCNFSSMNPPQSRILFLLSEDGNKCNVYFSLNQLFELLGLFWSIWESLMLPTSQGKICANLPRFYQHRKYILQRFRKYWYWHVLRFEKGNCEGRSSLGFSQDGAGGFFPVRICVFAMEALKKKIFPTLLRHVPQGGGLG